MSDQTLDDPTVPLPAEKPPVPLLALFLCFLKLGSTSFGGGTVGWSQRAVVEQHKWMTDEKFLQTLAISQVLPGPNPVNLAVYIGMHLRGYSGAAVSALGMIALPFCIVLSLGAIYGMISDSPIAQAVLSGLACVGIASILAAALKSARKIRTSIFSMLMTATVFVLVGVMGYSMIAVVCGVIPVSVLGTYWLKGRKDHG